MFALDDIKFKFTEFVFIWFSFGRIKIFGKFPISKISFEGEFLEEEKTVKDKIFFIG